jgi:hypothetical protein
MCIIRKSKIFNHKGSQHLHRTAFGAVQVSSTKEILSFDLLCDPLCP